MERPITRKDLTGLRFERLVVLSVAGRTPDKSWHWLCQCDCGKKTRVRHSHLLAGATRSCGCLARESNRSFTDLTGVRFGRLVAIERLRHSSSMRWVWRCKCDCGQENFVPANSLKSGRTLSCGCLGRERSVEYGRQSNVDLTGKRYGRLVAIRPTEERRYRYVVWECHCDCGEIVRLAAGALTSGNTKSCGCLYRERGRLNLVTWHAQQAEKKREIARN